ncbi:MAG: nitroreductase/quinone reductase family protein [Gaiellaceae bacterium]
MPKLAGIPLPRRLVNAAVTPLVAAGIAPYGLYLLAVPGRRTGRLFRTPVSVLEHAGARWLVAPYGERGWVKNARAAGWVELARGRQRERVRVEELSEAERGPVLRAYLHRLPMTRDLFDAEPGDPVEAFAAEAGRHPVFRVL